MPKAPQNESEIAQCGFQQQPDGSWAKTAGTKTVQETVVVLGRRERGLHPLRSQDAPPKPEMPQTPSEMKSEKALQEQIANWLRQRNVWFCRSRMDRKTSNGLGTPDFLFTWPYQRGGFAPVAVECKIGMAALSEEQERVRKEMIDCGWFYFVVRSLEELRTALEGL